ncbi:MAG: hypothetical protein JKY56_27120 [Kofleriaceae bacterium]|nr:hypothetical protein [Kofleriaceae bacterium]
MKSSITIKATLLAILSSATVAGVASAQNQPTNQEVPLNPFVPRPAANPEPAATPEREVQRPDARQPDTAANPPASPTTQPDFPADPDFSADPDNYAQARAASQLAGDESMGPDQPEVTKRRKKGPPVVIKHPIVLAAPTAHLLPAAVIYSSTSLDTGGGFGSKFKVGLGDVGEFGIETTDRVRFIAGAGLDPETIQPLLLASFKMGIGEDRLFEHQPALALGFRKSFETKHNDFDIRVAAIELVASKTLGPVSIHAGGVFWDASLASRFSGDDAIVLHDYGTKRQIRPIAGLQASPFKDSQLLVDIYWVPRFDLSTDTAREKISLRPALSWGVRYNVGKSVSIESGVRVPDIGEANLLDAQIFGQLTFSSSKLRDALGVGE